MATSPKFGFDEMTVSQSGKYLTFNEAVKLIEAVVGSGAISMTTTAEPESPLPSDGSVYIIPASATGTNWSTYSQNDVAVYRGSEWVKFTPSEGFKIWVNDLNQFAVFNGSLWALAYDKLGPLKVEDRNLSTLPTSPIPTAGTVYIVGTGSPQQFAPDTIAIADGNGNWATFTPTEGDLVYIKDEKVFSSYDTGSPLGWTNGISI